MHLNTSFTITSSNLQFLETVVLENRVFYYSSCKIGSNKSTIWRSVSSSVPARSRSKRRISLFKFGIRPAKSHSNLSLGFIFAAQLELFSSMTSLTETLLQTWLAGLNLQNKMEAQICKSCSSAIRVNRKHNARSVLTRARCLLVSMVLPSWKLQLNLNRTSKKPFTRLILSFMRTSAAVFTTWTMENQALA